MKKTNFMKKFLSVLLALGCVVSSVNAYESGETAEITDISVDANKCISWNTQVGNYSGANIYRLDKNNCLIKVGTTDIYSYTCGENGNYIVRAFSDYGESDGKIITVQDGALFEVNINDCSFSNGFVTCEINVKNISGKTASGAVKVCVLNSCGEENNCCYKKITMAAGISDTFTMTFREKDCAKTLAVSVWDSVESKRLYSNEIQQDYKTDSQIAEEVANNLRNKANVLESLINECESKGISTDYENINYNIINRFAGYVEEDLAANDLDRLSYTDKTTNELYIQAKSNLEAYLSGEKTPLSVPHYVTSSAGKTEGQAMYAMTENNGVLEERPVFYVGYLGYQQVRDDIPVLNGFGTNSVQQETGPSRVMSNGNKWSINYHNGPSVYYDISDEAPEEGVKSLRIKYDSAVMPNQFFSVSQEVPVEPGKTYIFRGKVKAENATNFAVSANNYDNRIGFNGTFDWKNFYGEYTAPAGKTSTTVRMMVDGPTDGVYFSMLSFKEKGVEYADELLDDGSFVRYGNTDLTFDTESEEMKTILKMLDDAETNNIAVSFLISPHYFFKDIIKVNNIAHPSPGSFLSYNVNAPLARQIIENYIRTLIPLIKDYKCINNICISNEPDFNASLLQEFYADEWHTWLSDRYNGDISALNSNYGANYSSFDEVNMQYEVDNNAMIAQTYDYVLFNNKVLGQWHKFMADIIHELAPDIPVTAKILGWASSSRYPEGFLRGTGLEEYYSYLDLNGCDYNNFLDDNRGHLTKEMWYDYMLSFKEAPVVDTEDHIIRDNSSDFYPDELADYVGQVIYQGAIHGRAMSDIWVWERSLYNTALRDSILYRPDAIAEVGYAANDLNRLAYEITALQNEPAEVGIIFSNSDLISNSSLSMHAVYEAYEAVQFNGQKARFILDINPQAMHNYKVVIVPNTVYITDEMVNELTTYVSNGGKVLLMGSGNNAYRTSSLSKNEYGATRSMTNYQSILSKSTFASYTGTFYEMTSMTKQQFCSIVRNVLTSAGIYYAKVVNADTNEPAHNIEYNLGVYNNKVIINLANFGEKQNVKIYVGDTPVTESLELRSNQSEGEIISLDKFETKTIRTNIEGGFR